MFELILENLLLLFQEKDDWYRRDHHDRLMSNCERWLLNHLHEYNLTAYWSREDHADILKIAGKVYKRTKTEDLCFEDERARCYRALAGKNNLDAVLRIGGYVEEETT